MATQREIERTVQPSLLDRLTDQSPKASADARISVAESGRQFKASVQRDLSWLLNARRTPERPPEELVELPLSLYDYGIPDITSFSRDAAESKARLLRYVEDALAAFEPRIAGIRISIAEAEGEHHRRELRFEVEGTLMMDPTPERVVFDTVLHFASGDYEIAGVRGA
ncbi:MAG TPA: type VI secretion system baseplate subunit TssE [Gemmatimonadaceae bacterium]|nr:type VI secretion system baseplate subunit TssE [Gemmatimonadaceae bacterium]